MQDEMAFAFLLHDSRGSVPSLEIEVLDDEAAAIAHGRKLLTRHARYSAVEVLRTGRQVADLRRAPQETRP